MIWQLGKRHFRVYSRFSHYPRLFGGGVEKTCGTEVNFNMVAIRNRRDLYKSTGRLLGVAQGHVVRITLPSLSVLCNNKEHRKCPPNQQLLWGSQMGHFSNHPDKLISQLEAAFSLVPTSTWNNSRFWFAVLKIMVVGQDCPPGPLESQPSSMCSLPLWKWRHTCLSPTHSTGEQPVFQNSVILPVSTLLHMVYLTIWNCNVALGSKIKGENKTKV